MNYRLIVYFVVIIIFIAMVLLIVGQVIVMRHNPASSESEHQHRMRIISLLAPILVISIFCLLKWGRDLPRALQRDYIVAEGTIISCASGSPNSILYRTVEFQTGERIVTLKYLGTMLEANTEVSVEVLPYCGYIIEVEPILD